MSNKLKNMRLTSVDLVRNGANQEADICLFKSADPNEDPTQPTAEEKNIFKRFIDWFRANHEDDPQEDDDTIEKDFSTFDSLNTARESNEKLWQYTSALTESIRSIQMDHDLDKGQKLQLMAQSLEQFDAAMGDLFEALCNVAPASGLAKSDEDPEGEEDVEKFNPNHDSKGRFASGSGGGAAKIPSKYLERFNEAHTAANLNRILDDAANDDDLSEDEFNEILSRVMVMEKSANRSAETADIEEIEEV